MAGDLKPDHEVQMNALLVFDHARIEAGYRTESYGTFRRWIVVGIAQLLFGLVLAGQTMLTSVPAAFAWALFSLLGGVMVVFMLCVDARLVRRFALYFLVPFLIVLFATLTIAHLIPANARTHPSTFGVVLYGLVSVLRPPFYSAVVYVGIAFLSYIVWFFVVGVDAWGAGEILTRLLEVGVVAAAALVSLYETERALRLSFVTRVALQAEEAELLQHERRSTALLMNVLPSVMVTAVRQHRVPLSRLAQHGVEASALQSDIVGFTTWSSTRPASTVVRMLNVMFRLFDESAVKAGVEKIKTIGDAYVAVAGLPTEDELHVLRCVMMGLLMQACMSRVNDSVAEIDAETASAAGAASASPAGSPTQGGEEWTAGAWSGGKSPQRDDRSSPSNHGKMLATPSSTAQGALAPIRIRVGVGTGELHAGIVGLAKLCYDCTGEALERAEEMESGGEAERVRLHPATYATAQHYFMCDVERDSDHTTRYFVLRPLPSSLELTTAPALRAVKRVAREDLLRRLRYLAHVPPHPEEDPLVRSLKESTSLPLQGVDNVVLDVLNAPDEAVPLGVLLEGNDDDEEEADEEDEDVDMGAGYGETEVRGISAQSPEGTATCGPVPRPGGALDGEGGMVVVGGPQQRSAAAAASRWGAGGRLFAGGLTAAGGAVMAVNALAMSATKPASGRSSHADGSRVNGKGMVTPPSTVMGKSGDGPSTQRRRSLDGTGTDRSPPRVSKEKGERNSSLELPPNSGIMRGASQQLVQGAVVAHGTELSNDGGVAEKGSTSLEDMHVVEAPAVPRMLMFGSAAERDFIAFTDTLTSQRLAVPLLVGALAWLSMPVLHSAVFGEVNLSGVSVIGWVAALFHWGAVGLYLVWQLTNKCCAQPPKVPAGSGSVVVNPLAQSHAIHTAAHSAGPGGSIRRPSFLSTSIRDSHGSAINSPTGGTSVSASAVSAAPNPRSPRNGHSLAPPGHAASTSTTDTGTGGSSVPLMSPTPTATSAGVSCWRHPEVLSVYACASLVVSALVATGYLYQRGAEESPTVFLFVVISLNAYAFSWIGFRFVTRALFSLVLLVMALGGTVVAQKDFILADAYAFFVATLLGLLSAYEQERALRNAFLATREVASKQASTARAVELADRLLLNTFPKSVLSRLQGDSGGRDRQTTDEVPCASVLFIYFRDTMYGVEDTTGALRGSSWLPAVPDDLIGMSSMGEQLEAVLRTPAARSPPLSGGPRLPTSSFSHLNTPRGVRPGEAVGAFGSHAALSRHQSMREFCRKPTRSSRREMLARFANDVGFHRISALNAALETIDSIVLSHNVEKIKSSPYLVVSGCPTASPHHADDLLAFAAAVMKNVPKPSNLRIGLHSGQLSAGILGEKKFVSVGRIVVFWSPTHLMRSVALMLFSAMIHVLYDVFGDTVNTASRFTSTAPWGSVQMSAEFKAALTPKTAERLGFEIVSRGQVKLKGKSTAVGYLAQPIGYSIEDPPPPVQQSLAVGAGGIGALNNHVSPVPSGPSQRVGREGSGGFAHDGVGFPPSSHATEVTQGGEGGATRGRDVSSPTAEEALSVSYYDTLAASTYSTVADTGTGLEKGRVVGGVVEPSLLGESISLPDAFPPTSATAALTPLQLRAAMTSPAMSDRTISGKGGSTTPPSMTSREHSNLEGSVSPSSARSRLSAAVVVAAAAPTPARFGVRPSSQVVWDQL